MKPASPAPSAQGDETCRRTILSAIEKNGGIDRHKRYSPRETRFDATFKLI